MTKKIVTVLFVTFTLMHFFKIPTPLEGLWSFMGLENGWSEYRGQHEKIVADVIFDDDSKEEFFFQENLSLAGIKLSEEEKKLVFKDIARFSLRKLRVKHFEKIPLKVTLRTYPNGNDLYTYEVL